MKKIFLIFNIILLTQTSFGKPQSPYPSGQDYFSLMNQHLARAAEVMGQNPGNAFFDPQYTKCLLVNVANRDLLGVPDPKTGDVSNTRPTPALWDWYMNCLTQKYLPTEFSNGNVNSEKGYFFSNPLTDLPDGYLSPDALKYILKQETQSVTPWIGYWKDIPLEVKKSMALFITRKFIYPGILRDYKETDEEFSLKILKAIDVLGQPGLRIGPAVQYLVFFVMISEEFMKT